MSATRPMTVTLLARVGESDVLNEIGSIEMDVALEAITDDTRLPGDAPDATVRVVDFDLAGALRRFADELERG